MYVQNQTGKKIRIEGQQRKGDYSLVVDGTYVAELTQSGELPELGGTLDINPVNFVTVCIPSADKPHCTIPQESNGPGDTTHYLYGGDQFIVVSFVFGSTTQIMFQVAPLYGLLQWRYQQQVSLTDAEKKYGEDLLAQGLQEGYSDSFFDNIRTQQAAAAAQKAAQDALSTRMVQEAHALVALMLPNDTEPLHKVTIIPREYALGVTTYLPERDKLIRTKNESLGFITSAMGGRAAEMLVFNNMTTGAHSDFDKATEIARNMVCHYGMSDAVGPVVYNPRGNFEYSEKIAELIDAEVKKILESCYAKAVDILQTNRDQLDLLANTLVERETMQAGEVYELLGITPRTEHTF